jgi:hypothetical protein
MIEAPFKAEGKISGTSEHNQYNFIISISIK